MAVASMPPEAGSPPPAGLSALLAPRPGESSSPRAAPRNASPTFAHRAQKYLPRRSPTPSFPCRPSPLHPRVDPVLYRVDKIHIDSLHSSADFVAANALL